MLQVVRVLGFRTQRIKRDPITKRSLSVSRLQVINRDRKFFRDSKIF